MIIHKNANLKDKQSIMPLRAIRIMHFNQNNVSKGHQSSMVDFVINSWTNTSNVETFDPRCEGRKNNAVNAIEIPLSNNLILHPSHGHGETTSPLHFYIINQNL